MLRHHQIMRLCIYGNHTMWYVTATARRCHLKFFVSQPRRGQQNRILAPYMNPNVLEPAQSHYYVGKNSIAERMENLGIKFPLMREQHPELFVWHKELPLTALVLSLTKVRNIMRHH